ncbi:MAG: glycine cleavage T C-terminal barrel domain-containing protein, partial [Phycisphaerales bacterium]|nr:glycine cleavage T C-terminal barrel domain-containing protein [Phycisphaerales bacterium]
GDLGQPIGVVTSSCLSPMLGSVSIAFAMLRTKVSEPGTAVRVHDEGTGGSAITTSLDFLSTESDA